MAKKPSRQEDTSNAAQRPIRKVFVEKYVRFCVDIPASVDDVNKIEYAEERTEKALNSMKVKGVNYSIR